MLKFRTGDSLWIFPRIFGSDRFFIGEDIVSRRKWLRHLEVGDTEVNEIIMHGQKHRKTGTIILISGFGSIVVGAMTMNAFDPTISMIGSIMFLGGFASELAAGFFYTKAGRYYAQGWRLYNYKASRGELQPITLHVGPVQYGAGLQVRW